MLNLLKQSLTTARENKLHLALSVVADAVFILLVLGLLAFTLQNIAVNVAGISALFQDYNKEITEELNAAQDMRAILSQLPNFTTYYYELIKWSIVLFFAGYALYSVFQGISWGIAAKAAKKGKFFRYAARFIAANVLWFIAAVFLLYLSIRFSMRGAGSFVPLMSVKAINIIIFIFFLIIAYFAMINYALLAENSAIKSIILCFKKGIKEWKKLVPVYAAIIFALGILITLFLIIAKVHATAALAYWAIVVLPIIFMARVFAILAVEKSTLKEIFGSLSRPHGFNTQKVKDELRKGWE